MDDDDFYDDDIPDDDEWDMMSCGRGPDGYCDQAGTEWCDWDCPLRNLP